MGDETTDEAQSELKRAQDALDDARVLSGGGGSVAGVTNRLYYAVFHAAQAALYARGENPSSHGHARQQFGQRFVLEGDASRDEGRLLGDLYDYRWEADYGGGEPDVDVEHLIIEAAEFIDHMGDLVERDEKGD